MTEPAQENARRAKAGRSPSYPGIPLGDAVERAKVIYAQERQSSAAVPVVMRHWGYNNPRSGRASVTFAALKKFGLITEEGTGDDRSARLTDRVVEILHNPYPRETIQEAALLPPIHRELWDEYKGVLPSDDNLTWTLIKQRGFTPSGAAEFVRQFRETIAYARLTDAATIGTGNNGAEEEVGDDDEQQDEQNARQRQRRQPRKRVVSGDTLVIPVPIIGGEAVIVEGQFPITEAAWAQFMAVLNAMKPGLVQQPDADDGG